MLKYKLDLLTPGRIIIFQNRQVRTPVSLIVNRKQLKQVSIQMNRIGISKYMLHQIDEDSENEEKLPSKIVLNNEYEVPVEEQLTIPEIEELLKSGE
jgi:hypothetical protein